MLKNRKQNKSMKNKALERYLKSKNGPTEVFANDNTNIENLTTESVNNITGGNLRPFEEKLSVRNTPELKDNQEMTFYMKKVLSSQNLISKDTENEETADYQEELLHFGLDMTKSYNFDNILVDLSLNPLRILSDIDSLVSYTRSDLTSFLSALKVLKEPSNALCEVIFSIFAKMTISLKGSARIREDVPGIIILKDLTYKHINYEKDVRLNILAFLCYKMLNKEPETLSFVYDIYTYIEMVTYTGIDSPSGLFDISNPMVRSLLVNWSKTSRSKFTHVTDQELVFKNQVKYIADSDLLLEILENKTSLDLVLLKISFIKRNMPDSLKRLLVDAYNKEEDTETLIRIFKRLNDMKVLNDFIRKTESRAVSNYFYECCKTLNPEITCYFIEALVINLENIDKMPMEILSKVLKSKYVSYITAHYNNYATLVKYLNRMHLLDIEFLKGCFTVTKTNSLSKKNQVLKKLNFCLSSCTLLEEEKKFLGKIFYGEMKAMTGDLDYQTKSTLIEIFLLLKQSKYLEEVCSLTGNLLVNVLKNKVEHEKLDVFIINTLLSCKSKKIDIGSLENISKKDDKVSRAIYSKLTEVSQETAQYILSNSQVLIPVTSKEFILSLDVTTNDSFNITIQSRKRTETIKIDKKGQIFSTMTENIFSSRKSQAPKRIEKIVFRCKGGNLTINTLTDHKEYCIKPEKIILSDTNNDVLTLNELIYYEMAIRMEEVEDRRAFYQLYIKPLMKLCAFYQKKGFYLKKQKQQLFQEKVEIEFDNVLELN